VSFIASGLQYVPRMIVPGKLGSYGVIMHDAPPDVEHRHRRYLTSRAENAHGTNPASRTVDAADGVPSSPNPSYSP
jgi:hypothetical protein